MYHLFGLHGVTDQTVGWISPSKPLTGSAELLEQNKKAVRRLMKRGLSLFNFKSNCVAATLSLSFWAVGGQQGSLGHK